MPTHCFTFVSPSSQKQCRLVKIDNAQRTWSVNYANCSVPSDDVHLRQLASVFCLCSLLSMNSGRGINTAYTRVLSSKKKLSFFNFVYANKYIVSFRLLPETSDGNQAFSSNNMLWGRDLTRGSSCKTQWQSGLDLWFLYISPGK